MNRREAIEKRNAGAAAKSLLENATLQKALELIEHELFDEFRAPGLDDSEALRTRHEALAVDRFKRRLRGLLHDGKIAEEKLEDL